MKNLDLNLLLACEIAKHELDPHGLLGRRQKKGVTALAKLLNVSTAAVNQWLYRRRPVPVAQCVRVEQITSGVVTRKMLRPNDWQKIWPELDQEG